MKYKAIERRQMGQLRRGPAHWMKDADTTWCGTRAATRGNRFSEVWIDVPAPIPGEGCPHCSAAYGKAQRG